jgi:hypothetical protein
MDSLDENSDLPKELQEFDVEKNIDHFLRGAGNKDKGRYPCERYASFDYCYNYFQSFHDHTSFRDICSESNIVESCLQLGFYLASWGMLRGSSFLLQKSAAFYKQVLVNIVG